MVQNPEFKTISVSLLSSRNYEAWLPSPYHFSNIDKLIGSLMIVLRAIELLQIHFSKLRKPVPLVTESRNLTILESKKLWDLSTNLLLKESQNFSYLDILNYLQNPEINNRPQICNSLKIFIE